MGCGAQEIVFCVPMPMLVTVSPGPAGCVVLPVPEFVTNTCFKPELAHRLALPAWQPKGAGALLKDVSSAWPRARRGSGH